MRWLRDRTGGVETGGSALDPVGYGEQGCDGRNRVRESSEPFNTC
jgi:hypothetical protein